MLEIVKQIGTTWAPLRLRAAVCVLVLGGCAALQSPAPRAAGLVFFVTPEARLEAVHVRVCQGAGARYRGWTANAARFEVEEGERTDEGLFVSGASGCLAYRAPLRPSRQVMRTSAAVVSAQSEWLVRPLGAWPLTEVHVSAPAGMQVATAWPRLSENENEHEHESENASPAEGDARVERFQLPETAQRLPSDVVFGRFDVHERDVAGAALSVVRLQGELAHGDDELVTHIAAAAEMVASVGGHFPSPRILAIVYPTNSDQPVQFGLTKRGGGASIVLFFGQQAPSGSLNEDWVTVHELAHLLHPRVRPEDRWVSEGIATYYQEVLRARFGWQPAQTAWSRIVRGFESGAAGGSGRTLSAEAAAMRQTGEYQRVYWGGTAFMLEADMRLRAQGSSLDEAIRRCVDDVQRTSAPMAGRDLIALFDPAIVPLADTYAARSAWPDTAGLLRSLGVTPGVATSVSESPREVTLVDAEASAMRDAIMSRQPADGSR